MENITAIIPARAGSKGIEKKNLVEFANLPLIVHSINFAKSCTNISRVIVTTDSKEIAEISIRNGAEVPFMRPAKLAEDSSPMYEVVRHAISELKLNLEQKNELVILLDPTSPLRKIKDVEDAIEFLRSHDNFDGIVSISKPTFNPDWVGVDMDKSRIIKPKNPSVSAKTSRQDLSPYYRVNGNFYIWRTLFASNLTANYLIDGLISGFVTEERFAFSIDSVEDLRVAELIYFEYKDLLFH